MAYQDRKGFVLNQIYGQVMILSLAVLNTYFPQYLIYTFIVFIAISLFITFSRMKTQFKKASPEQLREVKESRKVYEEESIEVSRLMALDTELTREIRPLAVSSFLSMFVLIIILVWYQAYFNYASSLTSNSSSNSFRFLIFLIGYEVPYAIMAVVNLRQNKALKNFVQIPRSYTLFEQGLVGQGVFIKHPMDNYDIKLDLERKFVEIVSRDEKNPQRIRLYSSKPDELFRLIKKYGFSNR